MTASGWRSRPWLREREGPKRSLGGIAPKVRTGPEPTTMLKYTLTYKKADDKSHPQYKDM